MAANFKIVVLSDGLSSSKTKELKTLFLPMETKCELVIFLSSLSECKLLNFLRRSKNIDNNILSGKTSVEQKRCISHSSHQSFYVLIVELYRINPFFSIALYYLELYSGLKNNLRNYCRLA